jgi:virginiamycin A acetyltransferase
MPGVKIGDGAIIASMSVVTSDVDSYAIVGGNPARVLKHRFDADVVASLITVKWWDWAAEKITVELEAILSGDIERLRSAAGA